MAHLGCAIGSDIGTSSVKAIAFDANIQAIAHAQRKWSQRGCDAAERVLQVDEQAQEELAEVRRAERQPPPWQELRQLAVSPTQVASHHDVVAADDDRTRQGQIDHVEESIKSADWRGVLVRIGGWRLRQDDEWAVQDGTRDRLQRTHNR